MKRQDNQVNICPLKLHTKKYKRLEKKSRDLYLNYNSHALHEGQREWGELLACMYSYAKEMSFVRKFHLLLARLAWQCTQVLRCVCVYVL